MAAEYLFWENGQRKYESIRVYTTNIVPSKRRKIRKGMLGEKVEKSLGMGEAIITLYHQIDLLATGHFTKLEWFAENNKIAKQTFVSNEKSAFPSNGHGKEIKLDLKRYSHSLPFLVLSLF